MILSLFILTRAIFVIALVFEFLSEHLNTLLELALTCRTAFTPIVSPFFAG